MEAEELVGTKLGKYTLDRVIGSGGYAWVYESTISETGEKVGLKVLKPRYSGDSSFETRFTNEIQAAADLDSPYIVRVRDVGKTGEVTYYAMEYYPDSLASMLERIGPLPEHIVYRVAMDICHALKVAHAANIVHRDIKVENIMIRHDGSAVLTDFGIARAISGYVTATGANMTVGTPHYLSPEQAQGRELDGRSDLYALGVTLYKAVTGDVPFRSSDWFELARMHVEDKPIPPTQTRPQFSRKIEKIILKCLAKHPDNRYASVEEVIEELKLIEESERSTAEFGVMAATGRMAIRSGPTGKGLIQAAVVIVIIALLAALAVL